MCSLIVGRTTTKFGKYAKEGSFGSSLSRKACGKLEGQSPSVKAQMRRGNRAVNRTANFPPNKGAAITTI